MRKELLIGCGSRREKTLCLPGHEEWEGLITLDNNPEHKPDIVFDLKGLGGARLYTAGSTFADGVHLLPFEDSSVDEIHAYEVLEHVGWQGDWRSFFAEFSDYWRVLKPGGVLFATVPMWNSIWAWGDPSHTRVINRGTLVYLSKAQYEAQVGVTPMSDFRFCMGEMDFEPIHCHEGPELFSFGLKAVKA